jgi:hypothetical protein
MGDRRSFLRTLGGATAAAAIPGCREDTPVDGWNPEAAVRQATSPVAVLAATYEDDLGDVIRRGLELMEVDVRGLRVVRAPGIGGTTSTCCVRQASVMRCATRAHASST